MIMLLDSNKQPTQEPTAADFKTAKLVAQKIERYMKQYLEESSAKWEKWLIKEVEEYKETHIPKIQVKTKYWGNGRISSSDITIESKIRETFFSTYIIVRLSSDYICLYFQDREGKSSADYNFKPIKASKDTITEKELESFFLSMFDVAYMSYYNYDSTLDKLINAFEMNRIIKEKEE